MKWWITALHPQPILIGFLIYLVTFAEIQGGELKLIGTTRELREYEWGGLHWEEVRNESQLKAEETCLILCDVWDRHWSAGASRRVNEMVPKMNRVVQEARSMGMFIIHAPSDTMKFYEKYPARERMQTFPFHPMPEPEAHPDPPHPIDASDEGSDTPEDRPHRAWTRQHPGVKIDQNKDGISDNGQEVWNSLQHLGIKNVIIMGVHTNMCVLNRPFAIKALVTRGMNVFLVSDLTDSMYNPQRPPYVDHDMGRELMVDYIESFWCPTIDSDQIIGRVNAKQLGKVF